jgi:hypothetical protein
MNVLIGCEESQAVCIAFRERGHEAFSCDLEPPSGGHPEWHLQMDVFEAIKLKRWDMGIFFPECRFLTKTGNKWFLPEYAERFPDRHEQREESILFVKGLWESGIDKISIENPIGVLSTRFRKPDQIIQPYYFGDPDRKPTCLWLKNLPRLQFALTDNLFMKQTAVEPVIVTHANGKTDPLWHYQTINLPAAERSKMRSKTFRGVAEAMATQWGTL